MNVSYQELSDRIRDSVKDLDRVVERTLRAWPRAQAASDDLSAYLDSVALNLYGFYSGIERIFELIARRIDGSLFGGEVWQRALLFQMTKDIQGIRPAVTSEDHVECLDEFRRFRHLVRNVYTMNLQPDRMSRLVQTLPGLWLQLRAELPAFTDFTEDLAAR